MTPFCQMRFDSGEGDDSMSVKTKVLQVLESNRNRPVSGQELADTLGVTRTAVWKAVKSLQEEG